MKKLLSLGAIIALLWGITKFWPSRQRMTEGRVEVKVNAGRPKTRSRRPRARVTKPQHTVRPAQQPRRTIPETQPVEV